MTLYELVRQWGRDRGIQQNATPNAQWLKMISEIGELADALNKRDSEGIKDGIGDVLVILILFTDMKRVADLDAIAADISTRAPSVNELSIMPADAIWYIVNAAHELLPAMSEHTAAKCSSRMIRILDTLAIKHDLTLTECLQAAYDEIKDRQGVLTQEGVFVKSTDPLYPAALAALQQQPGNPAP